MGGISIWQLLIILVIVLVLFGAKKLRTVGSDLGGAVKGFRSAMKEGEEDEANKGQQQRVEHKEDSSVIDVEVTRQDESKPKDSNRA